MILDSSGTPFEAEVSSPPDTDRLLAVHLRAVQDEVARLERVTAASTDSELHYFGSSDRETLIERARAQYVTNPIAHRIIEAAVDFLVGTGLRVVPVDKDDEVKEFLHEFEEENRMADRIPEWIRRTLRDGEVFIRHIDRTRARGGYQLRTLDPIRITGQGGRQLLGERFPLNWEWGIVTEAGDVETPRWYLYDADDDGTADKVYSAQEITHIALNKDSDMLHGRPFKEPVLKRLEQYEQFQLGRVILQRIMAAFWLVRKVTGGGPDAVSNLAAAQVQSTRAGWTNAQKIPPPGTMLYASDNIEYDTLESKGDGKDAQNDARRFLLDIAAGVGMSEWVVTGDASHNNRASSGVGESNMVKNFQRKRVSPFGSGIREVYCRRMRAAVQAGELSEKTSKRQLTAEAQGLIDAAELQRKEGAGDGRRTKKAQSTINEILADPSSYEEVEVDRRCDVELKWPEIVPREFDKLAKSYVMLTERRIVSNQTAAGVLGHDWEKERERIEDELAAGITVQQANANLSSAVSDSENEDEPEDEGDGED